MAFKLSEKTEQERKERRERYFETASMDKRFYIHPTSPEPFSERQERWGVKKKRKPVEREILFTGTGRCGTMHISKLFKKVGEDIGHDKTGELGVSSSWFMTDSDWYPLIVYTPGEKVHVGERKSDYIFNHTIHVVREPLACISSISTIFTRENFDFLLFNKIVPEGYDPFEKRGKYWKGMLFYLFANRYIEESVSVENRIRIEDIALHWKPLLERMGLPRTIEMPILKPQNRGEGIKPFFKRELPEWSDLFSIDEKIAKEIVELSSRYGYIERKPDVRGYQRKLF